MRWDANKLTDRQLEKWNLKTCIWILAKTKKKLRLIGMTNWTWLGNRSEIKIFYFLNDLLQNNIRVSLLSSQEQQPGQFYSLVSLLINRDPIDFLVNHRNSLKCKSLLLLLLQTFLFLLLGSKLHLPVFEHFSLTRMKTLQISGWNLFLIKWCETLSPFSHWSDIHSLTVDTHLSRSRSIW